MELFSSWTGADFLAFYALLMAAAAFASLWIPANLRSEGRAVEPEGSEEAALLAGGAQRHALAVIADLFARGALAPESKSKLVAVRTTVPASPAGTALLAKIGAFTFDDALRALAPEAARIEARLVRRGLLMRSEERSRLRWLSVAPFGALLLLGIYRQRAGESIGEPTGFLVALIVVTALLALARLARSNPRTIGGNAALRKLEEHSSRLRRAPREEEVSLAVALFGTAVLAGTPWQQVHAMRQSNGGDGGGSSGDSGGDSGCGGGGCGGCGG